MRLLIATVGSETTVELARWDDLVKRHSLRSNRELLTDMLRIYTYALACGVIPKMWRLARRLVLAWGYPAVSLIGALFLGLLLGGGVFASATLGGVAPCVAAFTHSFGPSISYNCDGTSGECTRNTFWLAICRWATTIFGSPLAMIVLSTVPES